MAKCGSCLDHWKPGHRCESGLKEIAQGFREVVARSEAATRRAAEPEPERPALKVWADDTAEADRHAMRCRAGCHRRAARGARAVAAYEPYRWCAEARRLDRAESAARGVCLGK